MPCCTDLALDKFLPFFFFFLSHITGLASTTLCDAKDFHFPSAGREDLGRLQNTNTNILSQRLVSAKC